MSRPLRGPISLGFPRPRNGWQELFRDSLFFVLRQWQDHFAEAAHSLPFPVAQGFQDPRPFHSGDVFERALLADALCDAEQKIGQLGPFIDEELDYLLAVRRRTGAGGWSYFPDLIELPPDSDDLAQVLSGLLRRGRYAEVQEHCEPGLAVLLKDGAHGDGSFETWILPRSPRHPDEKLQAEWVAKAWGRGPDTEVVANLLHSLRLYDARRFAAELAAGASFLLSRQEPAGWWRSSWYWGPFYGTWVVLRFLAREAAGREELGRAIDFLRATQRSDGGWGWHDSADALSTAFALLALAELGALDAETRGPALSYLSAAREKDGVWPQAPLIRMDLGRASGEIHQVLSYGSRTVTAGFVLKAVLAADPGSSTAHVTLGSRQYLNGS